jgi:rhamnulokinase
VSREELYETTGIQFLPFNTLYQLSALEHSSSLARADKMLLLPDLLNYWLTGEARAEATNASTTELLDARTGDWALPLLERLGIPAHIFPAIVEAGTVLGPLLPHVAEGTGLPATTPVVAVASHDTASAVVAVPARASGSSAYISSGTWSLVGIELDEPVLTAEARDANLTNERGFAGSIRLLKNVMGLWLVQECRRTWAAEGPALDYADIAALAQRAPADGPLFDPDRPELLTSGDMPRRIRAACISAGQRPPEGDAEMLRSIFESLACKYRMVIEQIEAVTARNVDTIHVIGGGARNAFLCQLTANISRRHVLARPVEAAAMGSLLVQLHAFGELGSLEDMREVVRQSTELMAYEPDPDAGAWGALYERFMDVVHVQSEKEAAAL